MKIILFTFLIVTTATTHAGWVAEPHMEFPVHGDNARIRYYTSPALGRADFTDALKELADKKRIQTLDGIVAVELLREESFQKELLSILEHDSPRELKEALKSAGNIHNPKMVALWKPFKKAVLSTDIVRKINAALAANDLQVADVSFEKLRIIKNEIGPRLATIDLWLTITRLAVK